MKATIQIEHESMNDERICLRVNCFCYFVFVVSKQTHATPHMQIQWAVRVKKPRRNTKTAADERCFAIDNLRFNVYEYEIREYIEAFACVDAFVRDVLYSISVEKAISYTKEAIRFQFHILRSKIKSSFQANENTYSHILNLLCQSSNKF